MNPEELTPEEKEQLADISLLVGRRFVSQSGNVAHVERIAPGFVGIRWSGEPHNRQDEIDFDNWAESILESATGEKVDSFSSGEDRESLDQALIRWRESIRKR